MSPSPCKNSLRVQEYPHVLSPMLPVTPPRRSSSLPARRPQSGRSSCPPSNSPTFPLLSRDSASKDETTYTLQSQVSVDKEVSTPREKGHKVSGGSFRTLAEMQPTVESDHEPSMLSPLAGRPRPNKDQAAHAKHRQSPSPNAMKNSTSRRGNVTALLETLKTAQSKDGSRDGSVEPSPRQLSPKSQPAPAIATTSNAARTPRDRRSHMNINTSPGTVNQTARSFFLPNLTHMNDFVSGALRWSKMKNGIPIFVKHGKVHDREASTSADNHADVEALAIPEEEEKIFVSLDKIRDEINELKEHDDMVSKQAEQLQEEVHDLQMQLAKYKSRRDSAMGTDSETSMVEHLNLQKSRESRLVYPIGPADTLTEADLEEQVASLKERLDQANRQISINEIHNESYINERDEALRNATRYGDKVERLQAELTAARAKTGNNREGSSSDSTLESELKSLRSDNNALRQQWKSLREENQSLRSHSSDVIQRNSELEQDLKEIQSQLESAREELVSLQEKYEAVLAERSMYQTDNVSLERHNENFYNDNKVLQQKNSLLDRRNHDLQDEVDRLRELLDAASADTGPASIDFKEIRNRLENQNRVLNKENANYQQQIIDLQAELATQRLEFQRQQHQLAESNEQVNDQLQQLKKKQKQAAKEGSSKYEEQQSSLAQQLQQIADKQLALAAQLKKSADHEAALQNQRGRRTQVVYEARQITQEIKNFMSTTSKAKPTKMTRIVDPKAKNITSEMSARSTTQTDMPMQEDYTQQIDLTQGSDYGMGGQQLDVSDDSMGLEGGESDEDSQSLPPPFLAKGKASLQRSGSAASKGRAKSQPLSILKNGRSSATAGQYREVREQEVTFDKNTGCSKARMGNTKPNQQEDLSGRFSVKSGLSGMSLPSRTSQDEGRFELEDSHEVNMTSALFMDDITLESRKRAEKGKGKDKIRELTADARHVYERLDDGHKGDNCIVCTRVLLDSKQTNVTKKTVRIERPTPITDQDTNAQATTDSDYEDQATLRPSQEPGLALAKVIKGLKDEEKHMKMCLAKKQAVYDECSPSRNKRLWKDLDMEIQKLRKRRDLKREQIYDLHDVLEGQKSSGQVMSAEFVELTIESVLSRDPTWDGIMDC
ncbi:hypothetical protein F4810DRAFT_600042 [Camillea tinctor]|nr:hypothetical protein F4810DRAFT_600042 [Camillea tinctor]